jgi:hypothetical protein
MQIVTISGKKYGKYKTVSDPEGMEGWDLLAIISTLDDSIQQSQDYLANGGIEQHSHVVRTTFIRYLFGLPEDDAFAEVSEAKKKAEGDLVEMKKDLDTAHGELKIAFGMIDDLKVDLANLKERRREDHEDGKVARKVRQKLEADIGKLREHLGTATLKEILGHD